jgi:hypothetical protein
VKILIKFWKECTEFLDPGSMKKYVNKIDELQKMVDSKYNVNEKRNGRSAALQERPDLMYCEIRDRVTIS